MSVKVNDEDDIAVQHFREYLRINTAHPNPDYEKCTKFLCSLADELNLERSVHECIPGKPFVIMTLRGQNDSLPSIMLYSHTDVVPTPDKESWKFNPFAGVKDIDGKIYGRGAQDMKSVGIQYIEAVRRLLIKRHHGFLRTIHIVWGPDEEIGGSDGMEKFACSEVFSKLNVGFVLDEGMSTENEAFKVYYAERCPWWIEISCKGCGGHGSKFIENTAAEKAQNIINCFLEYREQQKKLLRSNEDLNPSDVISVNLTKVEGGVQINVVPTEIKICMFISDFLMILNISSVFSWFDLRVPPTYDFEFNSWILRHLFTMHWLLKYQSCFQFLENQIKEWCSNAGKDVTYSFIKNTRIKAMTPITDKDPWWRAFSSVFKELNFPISVEIFPGSTDSRFIRQMGISSIGFTPINKSPVLLHAHDEFVTEETYLKGLKIYEKLIEKLANVPQ
ncbi:unnamed protein product [Thelazia callipaeda]|uniref:N-acyl-aliphatic-L-amino acid amidohydrolase n=1 Tax=Thelazia callipaeda TaxID=103827 RepID=A0A0N5CNR6_THECL|nr:unnamed protein product [Thelazia callipaeda]